MRNGRVRCLVAVLCLLVPAVATASQLVPVEAFPRHGGYSMPRLSPDGKYLALSAEDGGDYAVVIYDLGDMSHPKSLLKMPRFQLPADIEWVGPDRLVVEMAQFFGSLDRPERTGGILATDIEGKHIDAMFSREWGLAARGRQMRQVDDGYAFVAGLPAKANNHFFMQTYFWYEESNTSLYDVNVINGARHLVAQINLNDMDFTLDSNGHVRYASGLNNDNKYVLYRMQDNRWVQLGVDSEEDRFDPIGFSLDNQHFYAYSSKKRGPSSLVQMDPDGTHPQILAKDDFSSIGYIQWTAQHQPFAAATATGAPMATVFDNSRPVAPIYQALSKKFPNDFVQFLSFSEDGNVLVFFASSDRDPGAYYLFDLKKMAAQKLFSVNAIIDPDKMGSRISMHFTASDGMPLEAILTVPPGASMNNLPMVLMPHTVDHLE